MAREIFGSLPLRQEIAALDNQVPAERQTRMRIEMRTLVERASRWLVTNRRPPLDSGATVAFFRGPVQRVMAELPGLMSGRELDDYRAREKRLTDQGVPADLATRVAVLASAYALLGIVETADRLGLDPVDVARVHFALGERLGLPALVERIFALPRDDRWQTMARAAVRDDLYGVHQQLTAQVLESTDADDSAPARVAAWEDADEELVGRAAPRWRRSAARRPPSWPACPSGSGWCAACCPERGASGVTRGSGDPRPRGRSGGRRRSSARSPRPSRDPRPPPGHAGRRRARPPRRTARAGVPAR